MYTYSCITAIQQVEGDPKAPFSIATTPMYGGGCYFILWIAPLYPFNVEAASSHIFKSLWYDSTRRLNLGLPDYGRTLYSLG